MLFPFVTEKIFDFLYCYYSNAFALLSILQFFQMLEQKAKSKEKHQIHAKPQVHS